MKRICHGGVTWNVLQQLHSQRQDLLLSQLGCPLSLWQDPWLKAQVCGQGQLQHGTSGHAGQQASHALEGRNQDLPEAGGKNGAEGAEPFTDPCPVFPTLEPPQVRGPQLTPFLGRALSPGPQLTHCLARRPCHWCRVWCWVCVEAPRPR